MNIKPYTSTQLVRLYRDAEGTVVHSEEAVPLSHEQRLDLHAKFDVHKYKWNAQSILIDMVEAAHGIKE